MHTHVCVCERERERERERDVVRILLLHDMISSTPERGQGIEINRGDEAKYEGEESIRHKKEGGVAFDKTNLCYC